MTESPESLPGCITYYEIPLVPNGPCYYCNLKKICKASREKPK